MFGDDLPWLQGVKPPTEEELAHIRHCAYLMTLSMLRTREQTAADVLNGSDQR